jgi:phospholipase D1/2
VIKLKETKQQEEKIPEFSMKERFFGHEPMPELTHNALPRDTMKGSPLLKEYTSMCQILRSSGEWSMGLQEDQVERSIQMAYIELISKAQKFIYIENQFFVSSLCGEPVSNQVAEAIVQRILKAIEEKADFLIVIVLPLLPGFEGDLNSKNANVMRIQLGWELNTICRGGNSIMER